MINFAYSMFELKSASQRSADRKAKTGSVVYETASTEKETWFDSVMGKAKSFREATSKVRGEMGTKMRQKVEGFASEKLGIPAHKLHVPTKLKQKTKVAADDTKSMAKWWSGAELKSLVSYGAVNIFGQLDIWGKEFSKAMWGGINSLPMSTGKSQTSDKMLDALLASQASRANNFRL